MVEYEVPDRDGDGKGEVIALVTTIAQMTAAPARLPPAPARCESQHPGATSGVIMCP